MLVKSGLTQTNLIPDSFLKRQFGQCRSFPRQRVCRWDTTNGTSGDKMNIGLALHNSRGRPLVQLTRVTFGRYGASGHDLCAF